MIKFIIDDHTANFFHELVIYPEVVIVVVNFINNIMILLLQHWWWSDSHFRKMIIYGDFETLKEKIPFCFWHLNIWWIVTKSPLFGLKSGLIPPGCNRARPRAWVPLAFPLTNTLHLNWFPFNSWPQSFLWLFWFHLIECKEFAVFNKCMCCFSSHGFHSCHTSMVFQVDIFNPIGDKLGTKWRRNKKVHNQQLLLNKSNL